MRPGVCHADPGGRARTPMPCSPAAPALPELLERTTTETGVPCSGGRDSRVSGDRGRSRTLEPAGPGRPRPRSPPSGSHLPPPAGAAPGARQWPVSMTTGQARPERPGRCPVRAPLPQRAPRGLPAGQLCAPGPWPPLLAQPALTSATARRRRRVPARLPHSR